MSHVDQQWFIDAYDKAVDDAGDEGSSVKETRETVADMYEKGVESGEFARLNDDIHDEGLALFDRYVRPRREQRKKHLQTDMEYIVDCINDETILGQDDPQLNVAYPLGDGRDKILRTWTAGDWRNSAMTRYRKAAEATASASIFDDLATRIAETMVIRGAIKTGDLFPDAGESVA